MTEGTQALLRIEVPFCVHPCDWRPACKVIAGWNTERQHVYIQAVCNEIKANAQEFSDLTFTAVRLGGGIASLCGEDIAVLMRCVRENLALTEGAPVTMRSSISNISGANMTWFKRAGITRFDFEMMALTQQLFNRLNTNDSLYDFETICDYILRPATNEVLGLILAYGMSDESPKRAVQNVRDSAIACVRSHAVHAQFIAYEGEDKASEDLVREQLTQAREVFAEAGFREYLPLHFSRGEQDDVYFASRFSRVPELAFGLGAQSTIDGVVATNTTDFETYVQYSADYAQITASVEPCLQQAAQSCPRKESMLAL